MLDRGIVTIAGSTWSFEDIPRNIITIANPILAGAVWTLLTASGRDFSLARSSGRLPSSVLGSTLAEAPCCRSWTDPVVDFSDRMDLRDTWSPPTLCPTLLSNGKDASVISKSSASGLHLRHLIFSFPTKFLAHRSHTTVLIPPTTIKTGKYHRAL